MWGDAEHQNQILWKQNKTRMLSWNQNSSEIWGIWMVDLIILTWCWGYSSQAICLGAPEVLPISQGWHGMKFKNHTAVQDICWTLCELGLPRFQHYLMLHVFRLYHICRGPDCWWLLWLKAIAYKSKRGTGDECGCVQSESKVPLRRCTQPKKAAVVKSESTLLFCDLLINYFKLIQTCMCLLKCLDLSTY